MRPRKTISPCSKRRVHRRPTGVGSDTSTRPASGHRMSGDELTLDIDAFLEPLDRDPKELDREWELHQSHLALPPRLWALLRFGESREYAQLARTGDEGRSLEEVDRQIRSRLNELGDGQLDRIEADVYQSALTWLARLLVAEDKVIDARERAALETIGWRRLRGESDQVCPKQWTRRGR